MHKWIRFSSESLNLIILHEKYGAGRNDHFQSYADISDLFGLTRYPTNPHTYNLKAIWSFFSPFYSVTIRQVIYARNPTTFE